MTLHLMQFDEEKKAKMHDERSFFFFRKSNDGVFKLTEKYGFRKGFKTADRYEKEDSMNDYIFSSRFFEKKNNDNFIRYKNGV